MMRTKIIIIGAGPTGLMAACQLARFNCDLIIVDRKTGPTLESRAMIVTPRSLEIFQQMGLGTDLLAKSKPVPDFSIFIGGRQKASFSLSENGSGLTDFPAFQSFEQYHNEKLLYGFLLNTGRDVMWRTEFKELRQHGDLVTAKLVQTVDGTIQTLIVEGSYLLACDGATSPVRHALKIKFRGGTYYNKFFVADAKIEWEQSPNRLIATPARGNFCAFFPMNGGGAYRILGTLPKRFSNREIESFEVLKPVILATAQISMHIAHVNWFSIYHLHHRCIDHFRYKNCFLLGDAAHVHSPAGGQGMNTGLQDAHNIAWKLGLAVKQRAGSRLLDTYHTERQPFAKWLLKFTDRVFDLMTRGTWLHHIFRKHILHYCFKLILLLPGVKKIIFMTLSQLWYNYDRGPARFNRTIQKIKFKPGDRCPYINYLPNEENTYYYLNFAGFVLFIIGDFSRLPDFRKLEFLPEIKVVCLPYNLGWADLGVTNKLAILIRPDQFIGLIADEMSPELLISYFNSFY
ncbi:FAD-dependent oxidoreductase [Mucilaginibacter sp.]|uniref:FAD-dependent oxidoreductase n=1 Tax=Mucilaginibacter sp. TaxID=1882438 RepID=UPI0035BC80F4